MYISVYENGIYLDIKVLEDKSVKLINLSPNKLENEPKDIKYYSIAELQISGYDHDDHHGNKHTYCSGASLMKYLSHRDYQNNFGRKLEITQEYKGILLVSHFQFFDNISVIRSWNGIENGSKETEPIEYISSLSLYGISSNTPNKRNQDVIIHIPHNTWFGEAQWKSYDIHSLGYDILREASVKRIALSNTGSWSCAEYLPMGSFENKFSGSTLTWQIETSASWHWEIGEIPNELYLQLSGPTLEENSFVKLLKPGESFESVPCAIALVNGDFEKSIAELTKYRRAIRRKNEDNEKLNVIFNDYMNCLMGNPTTEALIPLIDAAFDAGCEYFCVDCGWYADGFWWDTVGEWLPSKKRFPNSIKEVFDYIRSKGMTAGLWLELEVMGIKCPLANKLPDDWFFMRNGRRIIDQNRYQLDFRNPAVREYATGIIKRVIEDYGVGYIKMDYNIDVGVGTDYNADSTGEGLLSHTRAYLAWLDSIFEMYPNLVIENCSSGGMRMDYSHLSRYSIQSVTDQEDYILMSAIAANCMTACAPEQAAIWSYPLKKGDIEETVYNMVNAMLLRIHQSGHLAEIDKERLKYVKEGIAYYKTIRDDIKSALPFWPIGLADMNDEYISVGLDCKDKKYIAVWRMKGEDLNKGISLPIKNISSNSKALCAYPKDLDTDYSYDSLNWILNVTLKPKTARIFEINS